MTLRTNLRGGTATFYSGIPSFTRSPALPNMPAACFAPDGGGGGGSKLSDLLKENPELKGEIDAMIAAANSKLEAKRDEILKEKKKLQDDMTALQDKFKAFDGVDADKVKALLEKFEGDEDSKLIKDGKIDEVIEKRAARIIAKHEKAVADATEREKAANEKAGNFLSRWKTERLDNFIAKKVTGLADGALPKVQRDARDLFDIDDEGNVVTKEGAPTDSKGKALTLETYGEYLIEASPFYFPPSGGAGGQGGGKGGGKGGKQIAWNDSAAIGGNLEGLASGEVGVKS